MARLAARFLSLVVPAVLSVGTLAAQIVMMGGPGGGQAVRGTVTSATADSISIKSDEGVAYKIIVTPNTRIMQQREAVKAADIKPGEYVMAMGQTDDAAKEIHAAMVGVIPAEQAAQMKARAAEMQASLGKTWITGKVSAINETKLTIERPDKVSQVIELDENTSMHRGGRGAMMAMGGGMGMGGPGGGMGMRRNQDGGQPQGPPPEGEAITLADIKVGDNIMAQGALQGGTFVPKTLNVLPARVGRRGPGGGNGNQPQQ